LIGASLGSDSSNGRASLDGRTRFFFLAGVSIVSARIAAHAHESVSQNAAFEVGADLAFDEAGDGRPHRSRAGEEGLELVADDLVEERFLGLVAFVLDGEGAVGTGARRRGERPESCLVEGTQASGVLACTGLRASNRETTASSRSVCEKSSTLQDDLKMTWT